MLVHLSIRELAVVASLDLDFRSGLTVLTGETGAGKSILLTALGLALGERADSGFIRPGAEKAEINLEFDLVDCADAAEWLELQDMAEDNVCLVRRVISQDGRSKAYVNGRPVTLQLLQKLGSLLVEIHGQHSHVQLLQSTEQRRLLDDAVDNRDLLSRVESLYKRRRALLAGFERQEGQVKEQLARKELLVYQVDELEQNDIAELDYASLTEEHYLQANYGRILSTGQTHLESLYDNESISVNFNLIQAANALSDLGDAVPEFIETAELLREAQVLVKEAALGLRRKLDGLDVDPVRLRWLEDRLASVHRLARKHQVRPEDLSAHLQSLQAELSAIDQGSDSLDTLRAEFEQVCLDYDQAAGELSERRKVAAAPMQESISAIIRELGMPHGNLVVKVANGQDREPSVSGYDQVEFLVSANTGMPPRPLSRVASGGELSRISLAIQVAAIHSKTVATLVFDEVDTGIGGGTAEIVGQKLRMLGASGKQVFCVTHLPQVASQGHEHLLVEKTSMGDSTQSQVRALEGSDRVREVARMLGGVRLTENTLAHAEEMLNLAK